MRTFQFAWIFTLILSMFLFAGCTCGDDDDDNDTGDLPIVDDTADDDADDDTGSDDTVSDDTADDDTADDTTDDTTDDDTGDDDTFIPDYVVSFDGTTGYAESAADLSPALSNTFTFEGWGLLNNAAPTDDQVLIEHYFPGTKTVQGVEVYYSSYSYLLIFGFYDMYGMYNQAVSLAVAPIGTWFHFAGTYWDNGTTATICLFLDGVNQGCNTGDILGSFNASVVLSKVQWSDYCYVDGEINEVRLSSIVRYDDDFTVPTERFTIDSNTLALYHFDEGAGTTIGDSTSNGNDLDLYGGYDWMALSK